MWKLHQIEKKRDSNKMVTEETGNAKGLVTSTINYLNYSMQKTIQTA